MIHLCSIFLVDVMDIQRNCHQMAEDGQMGPEERVGGDSSRHLQARMTLDEDGKWRVCVCACACTHVFHQHTHTHTRYL